MLLYQSRLAVLPSRLMLARDLLSFINLVQEASLTPHRNAASLS